MASFDGAFNDIGLVDVKIMTPMGYMSAKNLGPNDVAILLQPGNDGNVMNIVEGSTGQVLANKSYKVKNWSVTIRFLRHSLDYCKVTHIIQEIINGNMTAVSLSVTNKNFSTGKANQINSGNESLTAGQAFLVNFSGLEAGAGADGDFEVTFKTSGAEYVSGQYIAWGNQNLNIEIPDTKASISNQGTDSYAISTAGEALTTPELPEFQG